MPLLLWRWCEGRLVFPFALMYEVDGEEEADGLDQYEEEKLAELEPGLLAPAQGEEIEMDAEDMLEEVEDEELVRAMFGALR